MNKSLGTLIGLVAFASLGVGTASAEVLINQNEEPLGEVRSDRYIIPPTAATMNIRAADDFDVPVGETWTLNESQVFGRFDLENEQAPPSQLYVTIYANEATVFDDGFGGTFTQNSPGAVIYDSGDPLPATGGPDYTIPIPNVPALSAGKYWISVQQDGAQYYQAQDESQHTQQWFWHLVPNFSFSTEEARIMTDGALTPGCDDDPWEVGPWYRPTCDDEQQGEEFAAAASSGEGGVVTPRGGPPPLQARMVISGTRARPSGTASSTTPPATTTSPPATTSRKKCKKRRVLKRGKCVKRKRKAKKVDPGFTG